MVTPVQYIGTSKPFFETAITGGQQSWYPNQVRDRTDSDAALLIASGQFSKALVQVVDPNQDAVDGSALSPQIAALVSGAGNRGGFASAAALQAAYPAASNQYSTAWVGTTEYVSNGTAWVPVTASGSSVTDTRKLAKWFSGGYDGRTVLWVGDSTTEQLAALNLVPYVAASNQGQGLTPAILGRVNYANRGANGQTLAGFIGAGTATNAGGIPCKLDDICAELATLTNPLIVLCYGLNDERTDSTIAGTAYGSSAQIAAANALRVNYRTACTRMVTANPNTSIIIRMPNGLRATSAYFTGGVTGQNIMDTLRLAFRGDLSLGIVPIDEFCGGPVILWDAFRAVYGDTVRSNNLTNSDGLHPQSGYGRTLSSIGQLIAGPEAATLVSTAQAAAAAAYERAAGNWSGLPRGAIDVKLSGLYEKVASVSSQTLVTNSFWDVSVNVSGSAVTSDQLASGMGGTAQPMIVTGDIIVWEPVGLSAQLLEMTSAASAPGNNAIRMGTFGLTTAQVPNGSLGTVWRQKWASAETYRFNDDLKSSNLMQASATMKNAYRAYVTSGSNGSISLRGIGALSTSLAAHTMTTSDRLCLLGFDDGNLLGLDLSSATFSGPSAAGMLTITLSGVDFSNSPKQAVILSNT